MDDDALVPMATASDCGAEPVVTPDDKPRILIIGASSGIGLAATKLALSRGFPVRAFSRSARKIELDHERLEKVSGDATSRADVEAALKDTGAVIEALGVPLKPQTVLQGTSLFSEATAVLVGAMRRAGVSRLVAVTGFGAGQSKEAIPAWQRPGFKLVFERIYHDKGIQERQIRESDLDWTIVRPTILTNEKRSGRYRLVEPHEVGGIGRVARADVADFMVSAIEHHTHIGAAPVITR